MKAEQLIEFIQQPGALDAASMPVLEAWLEEYPYFQTAHLLRIKNLQNLNTQPAQEELHFTAAYVSDRKVLYYLLHTPAAEEPEEETVTLEEAPVEVHEKEYKESLKENISDAVTQQYNKYKEEEGSQRELTPGLAIDIRKEYGATRKPAPVVEVTARKHLTDTELLELADDEAFDAAVPQLDEVDDADAFELENGTAIHAELTGEGDTGEKVQEDAPVDTVREVRAEIPYDLNALYSDDAGQKTDNASLIDQFIQTNPKISGTPGSGNEQEDISVESVQEHESFFTDTLAQIYMKQGNYTKAILAYEKLSLKYPEKSTYFAGQISEIKKLIHKS